jgi:hypothetical protein
MELAQLVLPWAVAKKVFMFCCIWHCAEAFDCPQFDGLLLPVASIETRYACW